MNKWLIAVLMTVLTSVSHADWRLLPEQSQFYFMSIKSGNIAEVHTFKKLQGGIDGNGEATVEIDLSSVDTGISIRDERMQKMLFQTEAFPKAVITATVDSKSYANLKPGQTDKATVVATLAIHGTSSEINTDLQITRLADNRVQVATIKPIIVNAPQLELAAGIEKLREVAGLPAISLAVPVTFKLVFATK